MAKINTCIFISGTGTNLKKILLNSNNYNFPIKIKLIVSNNKDAKGIVLAKKWSIPVLIIDKSSIINEEKTLKILKNYNVSLILLAGYMKILSKKFLRSFGRKILNIHPSLLPKFKGLNTFVRMLKAKEKSCGCTVHYVNDKLDAGKIVLKKYFFISKTDNFLTLKKKTQLLEHKAYSEAIYRIFMYS